MQPDTDASAASMALASKLGAVLAHARRSGASHVDVLPDDVLRVVFPSPSMEQSTMTPISSLAMEEARLAAEEAAEMAATSGDAALEEGEDMRGDESMVLDDAPTPGGRTSQPGDSTSMTDSGRPNRRERRRRKPTVRSRAWRAREPAQPMPQTSVFTPRHEHECDARHEPTRDEARDEDGGHEATTASRERGEAMIRAVQQAVRRDWSASGDEDDDTEEEERHSRSLTEEAVHKMPDDDIEEEYRSHCLLEHEEANHEEPDYPTSERVSKREAPEETAEFDSEGEETLPSVTDHKLSELLRVTQHEVQRLREMADEPPQAPEEADHEEPDYPTRERVSTHEAPEETAEYDSEGEEALPSLTDHGLSEHEIERLLEMGLINADDVRTQRLLGKGLIDADQVPAASAMRFRREAAAFIGYGGGGTRRRIEGDYPIGEQVSKRKASEHDLREPPKTPEETNHETCDRPAICHPSGLSVALTSDEVRNGGDASGDEYSSDEDDDECSSDEADLKGDLDETATLPGVMAVRHGGRPRLLPIALLGLLGLCVPPAAPSAQPMITEHADITTGNRRRLWPGAPIVLTNSASQYQMEAPHAHAASHVNEYVFELSELKYLDEPTTTSSPLIYNVRECRE